MDVRLLFPSLYLGAPDLQGRDVTLTITRLTVDDLRTDRGTEKKPVLYFDECAAKATDKTKQKRMVLNKTNATLIANLYGWEADGWKGKRITLYPTKAAAFGKTVDCIRVRDTAPATEKESA